MLTFSGIIFLLILLLISGILVGIIKKNRPILVTSLVTLLILLTALIIIWNSIPDTW